MKLISLLVIASQLLGVSAFASTTPVASPELTLVQSVLALQGMNVSDSVLESEVQNAMSQYLAQAPQDGQEQARFAQALIDAGVYTPAQAQSFVTDAQAATAQAVAAGSTDSAIQSSLASEISQLANLHPVGAQFSGCAATDSATGIMFVGGVASVITGAFLYNEQSCGVVGCSHPNRDLGKQLMLYGGIGAGVGAIVSIIANAGGCF